MLCGAAFDCSLGQPLRETIKKALVSEEVEDSDVYFVVYYLDDQDETKGTKRHEIGSVYVNLEDMLEGGTDYMKRKIHVLDDNENRLGELVVTVQAVQAMMQFPPCMC